MADWPCAEMSADLATPSVSERLTASRRVVTLEVSVEICPAACAWAVATVCRSRRSSFICDSTPSFFFCAARPCSATHTTSARATNTATIRIPDIASPPLWRETVTLLYRVARLRQTRKTKMAPPGPRRAISFADVLEGLPAQFQRELELASVVGSRRLTREARRARRRIAQL